MLMMLKVNLGGLNTLIVAAQKVVLWQPRVKKLPLNVTEMFSEQGEKNCDL